MNTTIILQVGVKIFLKNDEGKFLLLRRSVKKYPDVDGRWDIPGGRIISGTPLLDNLKREVSEETGLSIVSEPKLVAAQDILRVPGKHVVRLTYIGNSVGNVVLDIEENDLYGWFDISEILSHDDLDKYLKEFFDADKSYGWFRHVA